jgi:hypothetical protein
MALALWEFLVKPKYVVYFKPRLIIGFETAPEATTYCAINGSDPCCATVTAAESATSVLNPVNNTFVIAGSVAGGLLFLGLCFLVYQRVSKSRQRPTTAYVPNRETKYASKKFSLFRRNDEMQDNRTPRSSLFTTIRASQILQAGSSTSVPTGPLPAAPYNRMDDDPFSQSRQSQYLPNLGGDDQKVQVFENYDAGMDDELSCNVGDIIIVKEEYDDGTKF